MILQLIQRVTKFVPYRSLSFLPCRDFFTRKKNRRSTLGVALRRQVFCSWNSYSLMVSGEWVLPPPGLVCVQNAQN